MKKSDFVVVGIIFALIGVSIGGSVCHYQMRQAQTEQSR